MGRPKLLNRVLKRVNLETPSGRQGAVFETNINVHSKSGLGHGLKIRTAEAPAPSDNSTVSGVGVMARSRLEINLMFAAKILLM